MSNDPNPPAVATVTEGDVVAETVHNTDVTIAYAGPSSLSVSEGTAQLTLFGNLKRDPVRLKAEIPQPLRLREALVTLHAVVGGDYRYVPKDRTAYTAYSRMKKESAVLGLWRAQQAYFSWLARNDPSALVMLDPVISVHPDQVSFEVFSKDEGAYGLLGLRLDALKVAGDLAYGTTNIDFSQALFSGVQQMRSYRRTEISIGQDAVGLATTQPKSGKSDEVIEKKIQAPDSWIRGLLQVQSSAALPKETFSLMPIDFYNILRHLRMNGDRKGKRRGLRIELAPGKPARIVLEPWETVIESTAKPYAGKSAKIVRLWGRRRLMPLAKFLPLTESIDVAVLGSGMPSFWTMRGPDMTFTLGLTGFTSANWSQAVSFDLLLPRKTQDSGPLKSIIQHLSKQWFASPEQLAQATGLKGEALIEALQTGCQQGQLMYDLAQGVYRLRPLTDVPLDLPRMEYRNSTEKIAHDLTTRREASTIVSQNRIAGTGLELTGKVIVKEDDRDYRPKLLISEEGQVVKAECTCPLYRKQGLKHGPCAHLVALRLTYAEQVAKRARGEGANAIVTETRSFSKRDKRGEDVYQVTLERQKLRVRWGRTGDVMRLQTLQFDNQDQARSAYFTKLDDLSKRGYLDATVS